MRCNACPEGGISPWGVFAPLFAIVAILLFLGFKRFKRKEAEKKLHIAELTEKRALLERSISKLKM